MTIRTLETGQDVSVTATFRNEAGVLVDPGTVSVTVYQPDGAVLTPTPTITSLGTGVRVIGFNLAVRGSWAVRWASTNPTVTSDDTIIADWSGAPGTTQLLSLQDYRDITMDATSQNAEIDAALHRATRLIEDSIGRVLRRGTYTETLEVWYEDGIGYVYPLVTPIVSVPAGSTYEVDYGERRLRDVVADSPISVSWPILTPAASETSAIAPFARSRPDYAMVTYTGGFVAATLPHTLQEAHAFIARALMKRNVGSVIGAQEASVGDVRVKYPKLDSALDALVPGVTALIKPYKRRRVRF
jgi:hypothetical protein